MPWTFVPTFWRMVQQSAQCSLATEQKVKVVNDPEGNVVELKGPPGG